MSSEEDDGEKQHEPSQRRLDQAREKGNIARSPDLLAAVGLGGFVLAIVATGPWSVTELGRVLAVLLDRPADISAEMLRAGTAPLSALMMAVLRALAPMFLLPGLSVLVALLVQRGLIFTLSNLQPKAERISPLANARKKFGRAGLVDFSKNLVKLLMVSTILGLFIRARLPELTGLAHMPPAMATATMMRVLLDFLMPAALFMAVAGGGDLLWQHNEHLRRNRMSRKDMQDEHKEAEGDPSAKGQRRQRGHDIAMNRMLADVALADVVIVNPRHYAVALKWDRGSGRAPVCVAKGVDEIAARIRERAGTAGIPLHRDPPTARALHATVGIGEEIRPDHYKAVAAAIRFAEAMRKRKKGRK